LDRSSKLLPACVIVAAATGVLAGVIHAIDVAEPVGVSNPRLWSMFAGGASRVSIAWAGAPGPETIATPRWIKDGDSEENFEFYGQAGVVTTEHLAIAVGYLVGLGSDGSEPWVGNLDNDTVVAFSRFDGSVVWTAAIPPALLDSWSTPAVDVIHDSLIITAGDRVMALALADGSVRWSTQINGIVVNASPVVTDDAHPGNRMFITNYSFASGASGRLYCLNTSPFHPVTNPYQPGELIWSRDLNGQTSGSTPAYENGVVYVATATGGGQWDQGTIQAFPATATSAPAPLWRYEHTDPTGFFSGPAVKGNAIYASTYSFHGGQYSAATVRVNATTGRQRWSVPTNRTSTAPVPLDNGQVIVSGGLAFTSMFPLFGSLPSLQLIAELPAGSGAIRLWDSAMDTHVDTNRNGQWDPGEPFLAIGGWTCQPIVRYDEDGRPIAYVGSAPNPGPAGFFGHSPAMRAVDLTKHPTQAGFVIESASNCGGSPALSIREMYAVGAQGLYAFGAPSWSQSSILSMWATRTLPDLNGDGQLDGRDFLLAMEHASN
jgi:hypothetical protein